MSRKTLQLTDLVAPMAEDVCGCGIVHGMKDPEHLTFEQIIVLCREEGRLVAHVVFCQEQARTLVRSGTIDDSIGFHSVHPLMPKTSLQERITLGGDYPGLFQNLVMFYRRNRALQPIWERWEPGIAFALAPTFADEPYGLIGIVEASRRPRVFLYPSKDEGFRLLDEGGTNAAAHKPFVERSTLPQSGTGTVELAPDIAAWLVVHYTYYRAVTGSIR